MCSIHSQLHRFRALLSLTLLLIPIPVVAASPFATTSYQTLPTPVCSAEAVVTPYMGLSSGVNKSRGEVHGEPGPYEYRHPQVPLDVEGYPLAPPGLELEQVHVFVRHGTFLFSSHL